MGVLRCSRSSCENIMCERLSNKYGYLCEVCYQELLESKIEITDQNLDDFMESEPNRNSVNSLENRDFILSKIFQRDMS